MKYNIYNTNTALWQLHHLYQSNMLCTRVVTDTKVDKYNRRSDRVRVEVWGGGGGRRRRGGGAEVKLSI